MEVPLPRSTTALRWLHGQLIHDAHLMPRVYFSPRHSSAPDTDGGAAAAAAAAGTGAVSGAGAAWLWQVLPLHQMDLYRIACHHTETRGHLQTTGKHQLQLYFIFAWSNSP